MQKSLVFVVDIGKWVGAIALLVFVGCLAERTPISNPIAPSKPKEEEVKRRPIFPILRGELDDESGAAPSRITLGDVHPPDGSPVQIDFPLSRDMRNIRSKIDGQGMCVTTAGEMSADWAGLVDMKGFRNYCAQEPGGCDPPKFDRQLKAYCRKKGIEVPNYLFYLGKSPEILELALKTGRMPAISYSGKDGVQYQTKIAHVNNIIHLKDDLAGIYDNNYDPKKRIWMPIDDFLDRWIDGRVGWAIIWLDPPPPPAIK